jgi:hypothetical protein
MIQIIGVLALVGLLSSIGSYFWGRSDGKAIAEREFIAAQRDQVAELNRRLVEAQREKAAANAKFLALPDVRNRLCSIQGAASGCCQPEPAKCEP